MTYKSIFDAARLPPPGPLAEDLRFDMKMLLKKDVDDISSGIYQIALDGQIFPSSDGSELLFRPV